MNVINQISKANTSPPLFLFHRGRVVFSCFKNDMFGHVEGFAENNEKETILIVCWQNGETSRIHPANVEIQ